VDILVDAVAFTDDAVVVVDQAFHDLVDQVLGGGCTGGEQHGLDAVKPRGVQFGLVIDQVCGRAGCLADLGQADGVGLVLGADHEREVGGGR